jgi:hypothetical protein
MRRQLSISWVRRHPNESSMARWGIPRDLAMGRGQYFPISTSDGHPKDCQRCMLLTSIQSCRTVLGTFTFASHP